MPAFVLLIGCLVLGILVARLGKPPAALPQALNWWVINVALSALVLQLVPRLRFDWDLWFLIAAMWFVLLGSWAFFALVGRMLQWSRERIGALTLVCGLGNTSFIGFPMIEALRGEEGLKLAVVADQAGCFLALAVGGTIIAALYEGQKTSATAIARKVISFPPFISLVIGVIVGILGGWAEAIAPLFERIGSTLVPLALFSVGLQFRVQFARDRVFAIGVGLAWKLLLAPALVYVAGKTIGVGDPVLAIAVLESAMGPMISAAILAEQARLEPALGNTVLGAGIVLSLVTVPLAHAVM